MSCMVILIAIILLLLYIYLVWNNNYWKKLGVPYKPPSFLVGNTPNALLQKRNNYYDIQDIYNKFRGKFRFAGMFSFRKPILLVLDAGLAREVLVTNFTKFTHNDFADIVDKEIDPIMGYNPFFLNGAEWKLRRSEITPAFTVARIRAMYPLIEDVCHNLRDHIDKESRIAGTDGIDARELAGKYTTDVVSNCIFALDAGSLKDRDALIRKMGRDMFKPSPKLFLLILVYLICPKLQRLLRIPMIAKEYEQFFAKIMRDAMAERRQSNQEQGDFMQYLIALQDKKNLNDVQVVAYAITFFLNGFETSSVSIAFILFELGENQRAQDKLRAEILAAEMEAPLTMDSIENLPYLDQVIHEVLRLHPPSPSLNRLCVADTELLLTEDGNEVVLIKAGTVLTIPVLDIQRDAENFTDPLKFHPERFDADLGGTKTFKDKGAMLTFGDGPRICLGMRFAVTQVKAAVVEIIKNYSVTVNKKTEVPLIIDPKEFFNAPKGGIWVDFKKLEC